MKKNNKNQSKTQVVLNSSSKKATSITQFFGTMMKDGTIILAHSMGEFRRSIAHNEGNILDMQ